METAGTQLHSSGSQQALGLAQEPKARGSTRPRDSPLHLLHPVHAGDPDLGDQGRASQTLPAYLEDRGQVLGHFQSLSLHRVDHILHPGAWSSDGTRRDCRNSGHRGVKNCPGPARLASNPAAAPARPGVRESGGGAATRGGPAQLSPGRRHRRGPKPAEREAGARAAPGLLQAVSGPRSSTQHPFRLPLPLLTLSQQPRRHLRPHVTRLSRDT